MDLAKFKKMHSLTGLTTPVLLHFHRSPRHSAGLTPQHLLVIVKPTAALAQGAPESVLLRPQMKL